jgi:DNA-binding GntR family transcriptional regulator
MENDKGNKTLIEDAYRKIKQMIFQQKVIPGQRLVYSDLCKLFNMSRTPIINALTRLEQEGFLVSEAFRGFQVKPLDLQELWDLFGVREALESYAVEKAIERAEPTDIEMLEEKLRNHKDYMPDRYTPKKFMVDAEFHVQIAAMTKNKVLEKMLMTNLEHVNLRFRLDNCDSKRMPVAVEEHHELVQRMKKKNVLKSVEIIRMHVRSGRDTCLNCLSMEEETIGLL